MSSSGGNIVYNVTVNDSGVTGKVAGVNTSLKSVGTSAQQASTQTGTLSTSLNKVGTSVDTVARKTKTVSGTFSGLKSSFAGTAAGMAGLGLGIAGIGSQIANLSDQYDNLKDTELTLNKARTMTEKKVNAVTALELRLAKMRKDGKSSAADIKLVEDKLRVARDASKNAVNDLANKEDDYQRAQRAFYLQVGPQIIGIMAQMGSSIMIMKTASAGAGVGMEGMSRGAKLLSVAMKAIPLVAIAGAILAIRNNTFGFRDALESAGKKIGDMLPFLKPFLTFIHDLGAALGLTGGGVDFGKAFELLKTSFTGAIDTIMNTNWGTVLNDMFKQISNWFQNADWKVLWKMFQNAVMSSVDWINNNFGMIWDNIVSWFKAQKWDQIWTMFQNAVISSVDWINVNFKKVYAAIETWIKAQDWAGIWQAFQDAFMSSVVWVREKLGAVYTAVTIWAKTQDWAAIWNTIQGLLFPTVTVVAGTFDTWGANVIKELGAALLKSIKTLGGILSGTDFKGGLQQAFTDAGKGVDWISVGNAWLYNFFLDIGKWEFKTFHKTIASSFQLTFEAMAALIDFQESARLMVINIGTQIGKLLTPKSLAEVGLSLLNAVVGAAKATGALVQPFVISLGTEIARLFTAKNLAEVGLRLLNGIVAAAKATGAIVTPIVISIGTEVARLFTAKNLAELGKRFLEGFVGAVKALPSILGSLWEWIKSSILKGLGLAGPPPKPHQTPQLGPGVGPTVSGVSLDTGQTNIPTVLPPPDPRLFDAVLISRAQAFVFFVNQINNAKIIIPAMITTAFDTSLTKSATAFVFFANQINAAKITIPAMITTAFDKSLTNSATAFVFLVNSINSAKITFPAAEIDTFTKSIDSAYAVFNKMMVGIIQAEYNLAAPNIQAATNAFKSVEVNWSGYANKIAHIIPKITVNNSQALNAIKAVQNAMNNVKNVSRTITITTRYVTVGSPARHNVTGLRAHNITGGGLTSETTAVAPLIGGGNMTNNVIGGGQGDVNVTINMRDEFGIEKQRKFKAVLGKDRYVFGSVGAGG